MRSALTSSSGFSSGEPTTRRRPSATPRRAPPRPHGPGPPPTRPPPAAAGPPAPTATDAARPPPDRSHPYNDPEPEPLRINSARSPCHAGRSRNICDRNSGTSSGVVSALRDGPKSGGQIWLGRSSAPPLSRQLPAAFQGRFHGVDAGELSAAGGESARCCGVHANGRRPHGIENLQVSDPGRLHRPPWGG